MAQNILSVTIDDPEAASGFGEFHYFLSRLLTANTKQCIH
jgi:hypothetical protein